MQELQLANLVLERARRARESGCHGVVCSGQEVGHVKKTLKGQAITVVPGIRPAWSQVKKDDQSRIVTPRQAIEDGADLIVAGEGARFGYPPSRVWGTPTTAMWVYRMGLERAKRYLLTGDEIPAARAAEMGMILEVVPDDALTDHATALARPS